MKSQVLIATVGTEPQVVTQLLFDEDDWVWNSLSGGASREMNK